MPAFALYVLYLISDIKGTFHFMAFEAARGTYLYDDSYEELNISFFHNAVHDMESIHWVLFFLLKDVACRDETAQVCRAMIVRELFNEEARTSAERHIFLSSRCTALKAYQKLFDSVGKDFFSKLKALGTVLTRYYRESEAQFPEGPIDIIKFSGIHEEFISVWKICEGFLAKQDILLEVEHILME